MQDLVLCYETQLFRKILFDSNSNNNYTIKKMMSTVLLIRTRDGYV